MTTPVPIHSYAMACRMRDSLVPVACVFPFAISSNLRGASPIMLAYLAARSIIACPLAM